MSYATIHEMQSNTDLRSRVTACAAQESKSWGEVSDALYFYRITSSPGWSDAWEYAKASGSESIGANESVITDGMILSAVQSVG